MEKGTNKTELGLTDFQIKDLFSDNLPTHNVHRLKREKIKKKNQNTVVDSFKFTPILNGRPGMS